VIAGDNSEHRKMRAKQQHVCKEMNQYTNNTNRKWFLSFSTEFNIWLSSTLDLEVFELTPKETVLGIFSDASSLQKNVPFLFLVARNYIHSCKNLLFGSI
jgi:hypothetical protein